MACYRDQASCVVSTSQHDRQGAGEMHELGETLLRREACWALHDTHLLSSMTSLNRKQPTL